jgi:hypothetical protein
VVFHAGSISRVTFIHHIVLQIALDVYRILTNRHAFAVTISNAG